MVFNKKAISPVVATALLLVVAVVAVVGFENWFNGYSSSTYSSIDTKTNNGNQITIESLGFNYTLVKNTGTDVLTVSSLTVSDSVSGSTVCTNATPSLSIAANSVSNLALNCGTAMTPNSAYNIVIATSNGVTTMSRVAK